MAKFSQNKALAFDDIKTIFKNWKKDSKNKNECGKCFL